MLKIKLSRTGKKGYAVYRLVIQPARSKRNGKNLEIIGSYNPHLNPKKLTIKKERLDHWLSVGAQPTETVRRLIKKHA